MLTSEDLEKDLLRSAKPKHAQFQVGSQCDEVDEFYIVALLPSSMI